MEKPLSISYVSTTQVAEALGISVSSVKRWVEEGILPAHKTAGGHRKFLMADVLALARQNGLPVRDPGMHSSRTGGKRVAALDTPAMADELCEALIAGNADGARRVVRGAYTGGISIEAIADAVVAPALHRIGDDWEKGRIDVMHEHRASQLCASALYELKSVLESRAKRDRPIAVGGAVEGDFSEIPTLLAQMVLLDAGWQAISLGPNTPIASLKRAIVELKPRLMWLSISHLPNDDAWRRDYVEFFRDAEQAGIAVVVGGRAMAEPLRATLPYSAYGDGFSHLAAFARTLLPPQRRPRRGRPAGT